MGAPGTSPSSAKIMPVARIALGWALNCPSTSLFRLPSDTERVTIIPVAVEIIRAWKEEMSLPSFFFSPSTRRASGNSRNCTPRVRTVK